MYCAKCGTKQTPGDVFCSNCGSGFSGESSGKPRGGKTVVILAVLLAVTTLAAAALGALALFGNGGNSRSAAPAEVKNTVDSAISALTEQWEDIYDEADISDGYLEIKNTRVIEINPNHGEELFEDVAYVVEFLLFSDYYGAEPYYHSNVGYDCVLVYEDGSCKVSGSNIFMVYTSRTYETDYSHLMEEIYDLSDSYNRVMKLD